MNVITAINTKKPSESAIDDVRVIMIMKSHGRTFALHSSYNSLISCYMVSEYSTGRVFKTFPISKTDLTTEEIDRVVDRTYKYLDGLGSNVIEDMLDKFPVINDDEPEESKEPDYSDVEIKKRIKKAKEAELKNKVEATVPPKQPKRRKRTVKPKTKVTTTTTKEEPKKKRGRPKKKQPEMMNTLI